MSDDLEKFLRQVFQAGWVARDMAGEERKHRYEDLFQAWRRDFVRRTQVRIIDEEVKP